jgi:hypothetical protein
MFTYLQEVSDSAILNKQNTTKVNVWNGINTFPKKKKKKHHYTDEMLNGSTLSSSLSL